MRDTIVYVKCSVKITLSDGTEINLTYKDENNYIKSLDIVESARSENRNPVGVINSNTMKLEVVSMDRKLVPDNEESPYFGRMNNSAVINITLVDNDSDELGDVEFNSFYVSNWESRTTSDEYNHVIIEAVDLLSIVGKNEMPIAEINSLVVTDLHFIRRLEAINSKLIDKYKIKYNSDDIKFPAFAFRSRHYLIDPKCVRDWLNIMSQSTLTNIYLRRDDHLVTDYLLDDTPSQSVCTWRDTENILRASVENGEQVNYNAVKVGYISDSIGKEIELCKVTDQTLAVGVNRINDINFNSNIYRITRYAIRTDSFDLLDNFSIEYSKRDASISINNSGDDAVVCDIVIYGQERKENTLYIRQRLSDDDSGETLEIVNKILLAGSTKLFTQGLIQLIGSKKNSLSVTGYFNPRVQVGDIVYVDAGHTIYTEGYYKVLELNWSITSIIKCSARLSKIIGG